MRLKKILSILLSITMLISSLTVTGFFAYADDLTTGSCGENVTYSFDGDTGTLTISGSGAMKNYLSFLTKSPFYGNSSISTVIIGEGVTNIGNCVFYNCSNLSDISISSTVTSIGSNSFNGCTSLTAFEIPENVSSVNGSAFSRCTGLTSLTVEEGNEYFSAQNGVLFNTDKTTIVRYPQGKAGNSYVIPDSVANIGNYAFYSCSSLNEIELSENTEDIGSYSFYGCTALSDIVLFDSVSNIGSYAFYNCSGLTEIIIPNYSCTIYDNTNTIPDNITIKSYCSGSTAETYATAYSKTFESLGHKSIELTSVTNPTCTEQGYSTYVCSNCDYSYSGDYTDALGHNFGEWLEQQAQTCTDSGIYYRTCSRCGNSETRTTDPLGHDYVSVDTAPTCTEQGYTTYTCSRCGDSYVSDELEPLGHTIVVDEAVAATCTESGLTEGSHCSVCGEILTPQTDIEPLGHDYVPTVTAPTCLAGGYTTYTCSRCGDSYVGDETEIGDHSWNEGEITKEATYAETGTIEYTCSICGETRTEDINYVTGSCGENVNYSFEIATGKLVLSGTGDMNNYEYGTSPFFENLYIKDIVIESGVERLCIYAFAGCANLKSIYICDTLFSLGYASLSFCTGLESITVDNNNTYYDSRNDCNAVIRTSDNLLTAGCKNTIIPEGVQSIGECAFYGCTGLTHIDIPNSVETLDTLCFYRCEALEDITIPDSVTRIDDGAFLGCKKINHFVIPDSVTYIGENAFSAYTSSDRDSEATRFDGNNYILPVARSIRYKNKIYMRFDKPLANFSGLYSSYFKLAEAPDENSLNIIKNLIKNAPKTQYLLGAQRSSGNNFVWQYSNTAVNTTDMWSYNQPDGASNGENQLSIFATDSDTFNFGKYNDVVASSTGSIGFIACIDLDGLNSQTFSSAIYKTNKYVFYNNPMPFYAAKLIAEANGGYLATVTSSAENAVINQIKTSEKDVILGAVKNSSLQFEWLNGEVFYNGYDNFRSGQPDHSSSYNGQWFLHMFPAGDWDDDSDKSTGNARSNNGFIVEYAPTDVSIVYTETDATSVNEDEITLKATYPDGTSANIETESINITKKNTISYNVAVNYNNEKGESLSLTKLVQLNETGKCGDYAYYSYDGATGTLTITGTGNIYDFSNGASAHFANFYANVKTVIIENGITAIGNNTFNGCSSLESVSIPDTVEIIGDEAFGSCASLTAVSVPESVKKIRQYAFYKCSSLFEIVIPKGTDVIGKSAFLGCSALQSITVSSYNTDIFDSQSTIPSQASIKSCPDSTAQSYAEKYNREFVAFSHEFEETNKDSTCSQAGGTVHTCILCGYSYLDNEQPLSEHSFVPSVIPATCTEAGYNVFTCSECGYEYREEIPITPHQWNEGIITREPSCEENGERTYTCYSCGQTKTEIIAETGHHYSETSSTPATCTENGNVTYTCEICGNEYSQVIEATGHNYQENLILPTCTEQGYTNYLCTACGDSYTVDYVAASGHTFGDYVGNNDGCEYFDGTETAVCSVCGYENTRNIGPCTVYSENISVSSGDEISIPVYIKNNTGLTGFGLEFEYDANVLTPTSVSTGALIANGLDDNLQGDAVPGKFRVVWYSTENLTDNGILMYLNFTVSDKASGDTTINVSYSQEDTFNEAFEDVELVCANMPITISNVSQSTWYQGILTSSSNAVTAGDTFCIALDSTEANTSLKNATHTISYDNSAFTFMGYADSNRHLVQTSTVESTGQIVLITNNGRTYNAKTPGEVFETMGIKYLLFKANEYASSGDYAFDYSISDVIDIDEVGANGCSIKINASATSEIANIYIENGLTGEYADTVTVPVYISNNKGVMGYMINFEYDPEQLEIVLAQKGSSFPGNFNDTIGADEEGVFSVLWNGTDDIAVDGVLMNITFRVLTDEDVISPITITYSQDDTFNSDYNDVVFHCISGSIHLNEEESHQFIDEVVAPTPNAKGYTKHTCINCGYSYIDSETDYANDMSALEAALEKATGYDAEDYSEASYRQLQDVYSAYLDYPNRSIPQTTIDNATSEILTAISNLVPYLYLTVKGENGTVSVSGYEQSDKYSVLFGETITLIAIADEGYVFDGWYETVTKRIRSNDETFTFKITSNTDFEARFIKEQSATLTFANESGWVAGKVSKTVSEWAEVTTIEDLLPNVPYKLGYTNGRWVYDNATVLQKLQNGENVIITPEYDETDYENPDIPTPLGDEPALDLYYQLDADNNVGSFTMAAGFPKDCQVESTGIAFYYKKANAFNPTDFNLNINNKMTTSKFEASNEDGIYTVDVKKFTSYYNWSARGYVTYYDKDGNLKVTYSNQINIINREQIG